MASAPWYNTHRGQWTMKYKPDPAGEWVTVPLGKHPTPVDKDRPPKKPPMVIQDRAREFVEIEYRAKHGIGPAPQRAKPLGLYLDAYLAAYPASHAEGSVKQIRRHVASFRSFAEEAGVKTVQAVSKALCRDYLEYRSAKVGHDALETEKGYLSGIWSRAIEDELIAVNPWNRVAVPGTRTESEATFWTSEQIGRIAANVAKPWQADLVIVMANTGLRISAALWIQWTWVDWPANALKIPINHDKAKYGYLHILGPTAREVLERRHFQSSSPFAFPNPKGGQPFSYGTAEAAISRAIVKSKVPHGTPHDLRHSYARNMERRGVPMSVIQRQLGHRTQTMTHHYTSAAEDEARDWVGDIRIGNPTPPALSGSETSPPMASAQIPESDQ